jgi:hypothetical protein
MDAIPPVNHIQELVKRKKQARLHRGQNRLTKAVPSSFMLLTKAAERGYSLRNITPYLLNLLDTYGAAELEIAVSEALLRDVPHPNAIRPILERRREEQKKLPPVRLDLPDDIRVRDLVICPHNLNEYDQLQSITGEEK